MVCEARCALHVCVELPLYLWGLPRFRLPVDLATGVIIKTTNEWRVVYLVLPQRSLIGLSRAGAGASISHVHRSMVSTFALVTYMTGFIHPQGFN